MKPEGHYQCDKPAMGKKLTLQCHSLKIRTRNEGCKLSLPVVNKLL